MLKSLLFIPLLLFWTSSFAQYGWVQTFDAEGQDYGYCSTTDNEGNLIVGGYLLNEQ